MPATHASFPVTALGFAPFFSALSVMYCLSSSAWLAVTGMGHTKVVDRLITTESNPRRDVGARTDNFQQKNDDALCTMGAFEIFEVAPIEARAPFSHLYT